MHHIYHTHGFITSSRNAGEANKVFTIYTKEIGLIRATTQGVRRHSSKLRFALQDFSYARIDLVRGRDVWRVISATPISSFPYARSDKYSLLLIARISKLLERLCDGEEPNTQIFNDFISAGMFLDEPPISKDTIQALELYVVLRVMNVLGYIGESPVLKEYLSSDFKTLSPHKILSERQSIVASINKAFLESQL